MAFLWGIFGGKRGPKYTGATAAIRERVKSAMREAEYLYGRKCDRDCMIRLDAERGTHEGATGHWGVKHGQGVALAFASVEGRKRFHIQIYGRPPGNVGHEHLRHECLHILLWQAHEPTERHHEIIHMLEAGR